MVKNILVLGVIPIFVSAAKTFCFEDDQRVSSKEDEVGRILPSKTGRIGRRRSATVCTATLISEACALTAGHCVKHLKYVQFNVPLSNANRTINQSAPSDIYLVDKDTIVYSAETVGDDWAVFKLQANKESGKLPGEIQGFLDISFDDYRPRKLKITGHGLDYSPGEFNYTQQTDEGDIVRLDGSTIHHLVDTQGGNSGSTIRDRDTNRVIGIHTHAGCGDSRYLSNRGTSIARNTKLSQAIKKCLGY